LKDNDLSTGLDSFPLLIADLKRLKKMFQKEWESRSIDLGTEKERLLVLQRMSQELAERIEKREKAKDKEEDPPAN
jgi:hypothetical protein